MNFFSYLIIATSIMGSLVGALEVFNVTQEYFLQFDKSWEDSNKNWDDYMQFKTFSCNKTDCCILGANCLNFTKDFTFPVEDSLVVLVLCFGPPYYSYIEDKTAALYGKAGDLDADGRFSSS